MTQTLVRRSNRGVLNFNQGAMYIVTSGNPPSFTIMSQYDDDQLHEETRFTLHCMILFFLWSYWPGW